MLAEIFLLWLETTSRVSQEAAPASNSRFFLPNGLLGQKRDEENRNDVIQLRDFMDANASPSNSKARRTARAATRRFSLAL